jgi:hypothetical protein
MVLHKSRHEDQWIRIEDSDINPCSYNQMIFKKGAQNMCWRKDSLFNKCGWENWISTCGRLKLDPRLSHCTDINSQWIKDLNIKTETLKWLQEVLGNALQHVGIGNVLNRTVTAQHLRERVNKCKCFKLKSLCKAKEIVIRLKRQPTRMGENLCQLFIW